MAYPSSSPETHNHHRATKFLSHFIQTTTSNFASLLSSSSHALPSPRMTPLHSPPSTVRFPLLLADSGPTPSSDSNRSDSPPSPPTVPENKDSGSGRGLPPAVRIAGLNPVGKDRGPAFIGQVFSMCDLSGTGLMAVSTHFDIPFLSKRTPGWLKKMFATITKSERNGPVFHFFMDLGDAVSYVKRLNIPSGVVGACRLDLAYEHFKEKPDVFQFVPNEKQVKAANRLLKSIPHHGGRRRADGVPVFTAQNLDIAIATANGIKWYTPYFFDKNMLDNILEESVDQHFHSLIKSRQTQRWKDAIDDDNLAADVLKENGESLWEPSEAREVFDEMGHPEVPLSVISKVAEMQLLHAVDNVLLGNKWLRKAIGIQPKFPYMVDSFERRSAASSLGAYESSSCVINSQAGYESEDPCCRGTSALSPTDDDAQDERSQKRDSRFPFGNWFNNPWSRQKHQLKSMPGTRANGASRGSQQGAQPLSPFLPKITMVGISTAEAGQMSKSALKKTVEDLTRQLEQPGHGNGASVSSDEFRSEYRDPLFVADVGEYFSGLGRRGAARWVRERNI